MFGNKYDKTPYRAKKPQAKNYYRYPDDKQVVNDQIISFVKDHNLNFDLTETDKWYYRYHPENKILFGVKDKIGNCVVVSPKKYRYFSEDEVEILYEQSDKKQTITKKSYVPHILAERPSIKAPERAQETKYAKYFRLFPNDKDYIFCTNGIRIILSDSDSIDLAFAKYAKIMSNDDDAMRIVGKLYKVFFT